MPEYNLCETTCVWIWDGSSWSILSSDCTAPCECSYMPPTPGEFIGQEVLTWCIDSTPTSTTTTEEPVSSTTTTTTTTTTAAPCQGICQYQWSSALNQWFIEFSGCVGEGCGCPPPPETPGAVNGQTWADYCIPGGTTTTTTTTTTSTSSSSTSTSSSSTTTTSTTSTSTTSTSSSSTSTTTTTTTTAAPCTGGCTWRWSAAGATWLKYGPGNCSDGCSCQAPTTPGTVDGEYQTVNCGRLTCQACCNNEACCPPYPVTTECCDNTVPSILTVTIDTNPDCPCGATSFELEYSPTGFVGLGPGWYVRRPGDAQYNPAPTTFWVRNGTCVVTNDLCDYGIDTTNPNPENTYISALLRCVNVGSGAYNWQLSFSYVRLKQVIAIPPITNCMLTAVTTFVYDLDPTCSPFYSFTDNVPLEIAPGTNESGCDNPAGFVTVTISE